jgi:hypothetical protein
MPDLQGGPLRPPRRVPLRKSNFQIHVILIIQIVLSITVLSICIGLLATQPYGASSPIPISFTIFVTIFSTLTWVYIFLIAGHLEEKLGSWFPWLSIAAGALSLIFYLVSSLLLTVAIAPAQSCANQDYVAKNKLLAGSGGSRCRLIQANIALLWMGTPSNFEISDHSIRYLLCLCCV